jgi:hypothetical protein
MHVPLRAIERHRAVRSFSRELFLPRGRVRLCPSAYWTVGKDTWQAIERCFLAAASPPLPSWQNRGPYKGQGGPFTSSAPSSCCWCVYLAPLATCLSLLVLARSSTALPSPAGYAAALLRMHLGASLSPHRLYMPIEATAALARISNPHSKNCGRRRRAQT